MDRPRPAEERERERERENNRFLLSNNKALFPFPSLLVARSEGDLSWQCGSEEERRLPVYHIRINTDRQSRAEQREGGPFEEKGKKG